MGIIETKEYTAPITLLAHAGRPSILLKLNVIPPESTLYQAYYDRKRAVGETLPAYTSYD